jgi:transposase-like protein
METARTERRDEGMKKTRTKHSAAYKAKVALEAVQERDSVAEIARRHKLHPNVVYKWKKELIEKASLAFESGSAEAVGNEREGELLKKIGELMVERDFLSNGLGRLR